MRAWYAVATGSRELRRKRNPRRRGADEVEVGGANRRRSATGGWVNPGWVWSGHTCAWPERHRHLPQPLTNRTVTRSHQRSRPRQLHCHDHARELVAADVGRLHLLVTLPGVPVGPADAGGPHLHGHPSAALGSGTVRASAGLRRRETTARIRLFAEIDPNPIRCPPPVAAVAPHHAQPAVTTPSRRGGAWPTRERRAVRCRDRPTVRAGTVETIQLDLGRSGSLQVQGLARVDGVDAGRRWPPQFVVEEVPGLAATTRSSSLRPMPRPGLPRRAWPAPPAWR